MVVVGLGLCAVARAQPAPPAPPPPPYAPPAGPPVYAPAPAPAPPQPPSPPKPRRWTWSLGLGAGTLAYDHANGPCPSCSHSELALGVELSGGIEIVPGLAAFALLDVGVGFVDGLGDEGEGDSGKIQQLSLIGGGRLRIGSNLHLLGGIGVGTVNYRWEETSSGLFGSFTEEFEMDIGSGLAALGRARFAFMQSRQLDLGVQGSIQILQMGDAGTASLVTFGVTGGWF